jgi:hypothetical protein
MQRAGQRLPGGIGIGIGIPTPLSSGRIGIAHGMDTVECNGTVGERARFAAARAKEMLIMRIRPCGITLDALASVLINASRQAPASSVSRLEWESVPMPTTGAVP